MKQFPLDKLRCGCQLPPDYAPCLCGNSDDGQAQAASIAYNKIAEEANAEIERLRSYAEQQVAIARKLDKALTELKATVIGECPSIINDESATLLQGLLIDAEEASKALSVNELGNKINEGAGAPCGNSAALTAQTERTVPQANAIPDSAATTAPDTRQHTAPAASPICESGVDTQPIVDPRGIASATELRLKSGASCLWTHDDRHDKWDTGCGKSFSFFNDGPSENGVKFCHACGKAVALEALPLGTQTQDGLCERCGEPPDSMKECVPMPHACQFCGATVERGKYGGYVISRDPQPGE